MELFLLLKLLQPPLVVLELLEVVCLVVQQKLLQGQVFSTQVAKQLLVPLQHQDLDPQQVSN